MNSKNSNSPDWGSLEKQLHGELRWDFSAQVLYATDASAYRELPSAVAFPKGRDDLQTLVRFASKHKIPLIPRAAGTSLAGQVVGTGIVVDISKHFNKIIEVNTAEKWVRVQPGVVRDELNRYLKSYGLFFGPETSTANRAMIGGMLGNNSCGSNSIVYGSTREHVLEVKALLSDGSEVLFEDLDRKGFDEKKSERNNNIRERAIYRKLWELLADKASQEDIKQAFPKPGIPRRNTGYALDLLLNNQVFTPHEHEQNINLCTLIAGSEGTLAFATEIKLALEPLPPKHKVLVCGHFHDVNSALEANLIGLNYKPHASELMDHYILERTKGNILHSKNRFFLKGDPGAILAIELAGESEDDVMQKAHQLIADLEEAKLGYHFPIVSGSDISKVWNLRKAGLGLLSNIPGDSKPAPVIEDTAVAVEDLPAYIREFNEILKQHGLYCVHYAHAGSGELHLRPILNLKTEEGQKMFRLIAEEIAQLVKKYKGSLSGEHGDGRLRGEFIPFMIGEKNYTLLREVKKAFDPDHIFNPGKITSTPPMDSSLRYQSGQETPELKTVFDWSATDGFVRAAEQCNGSGDCRKSAQSGGIMCPSYMATKDEDKTTRGRANMIRELFTQNASSQFFKQDEIAEILDLCLGCKGCKSECPSNVDMARLKAEFMHQYQKHKGSSLRSKLFANYTQLTQMAAHTPQLYNAAMKNGMLASIFKNIAGFAHQRSIPALSNEPFMKWQSTQKSQEQKEGKKVVLCIDEFTNYNDAEIGQSAFRLLQALNYEVIPVFVESGRTFISKGYLNQAKRLAEENLKHLQAYIEEGISIVGIEPSALLSFRDEYPDLVNKSIKRLANLASEKCLLIDEFIASEWEEGNIDQTLFHADSQHILIHGHCHQKTLSDVKHTATLLSIPKNYTAELIPSGCCGMSGSFGYEKEHYELSMQIGELVLFPKVRQADKKTLIAATGTSCRHQIKDGTQRRALHPVEILEAALK